MMAHTPTIAVDFDGCLCFHAFPDCGRPRLSTIVLLHELDKQGWNIIIHSCRTNSDWVGKGASEEEARQKVTDMLAWLRHERVPYTSVWGIVPHGFEPDEWQYANVSGKPVADVYLDDRALNPVNQQAEMMLQMCEQLVRQNGDPLAFHRSLGRPVD